MVSAVMGNINRLLREPKESGPLEGNHGRFVWVHQARKGYTWQNI
jgi:hypothetical protein